MSDLRSALAEYLRLRRGMGFKLERDAKLLAQFLDYLQAHHAATVSIEHCLAWVCAPSGASPGWLSFRMSVVRGFAAYLHTIDPAVQVPPVKMLPSRSHRAVPYLYSDDEVAALITAAQSLRYPLGVATYQTLIRLLAVTGVRIGEALRLDVSDIDIDHGLLTVRGSKLGRSRLVPLHPTTVTALSDYLRGRPQLPPNPPVSTPTVFVSTAGTRLHYNNVSATFVKLVQRAGLHPRSASCRPRPHDLRHTFAVRTLLDWYRDGGDVGSRMPLLSTYLGHVDPANTYWYLQAAPELLAQAAQRLEATTAGSR